MAEQAEKSLKTCIYCLEEINAEALKCRFCSSTQKKKSGTKLRLNRSFFIYVIAGFLAIGVAAVWVVGIKYRNAEAAKKEKASPPKPGPDKEAEAIAVQDVPEDPKKGKDSGKKRASKQGRKNGVRKGRGTKRRGPGRSRRLSKKARGAVPAEAPAESAPAGSAPPPRLAWRKYANTSPSFSVQMPGKVSRFSFDRGKVKVRSLAHKSRFRNYRVFHFAHPEEQSKSDGISAAWSWLKRRTGGKVLKRGWVKFNGGFLALDGVMMTGNNWIHEVKIFIEEQTLFAVLTETDSSAPGFGALTHNGYRFFSSFKTD